MPLAIAKLAMERKVRRFMDAAATMITVALVVVKDENRAPEGKTNFKITFLGWLFPMKHSSSEGCQVFFS